MTDTTDLLGTVGSGSRARGRDLLTAHGISPTYGFLSARSVDRLPAGFARWERIAAELPYLATSGRLRGIADALPILDVDVLDDVAHQRRAQLLLTFLAGAYRCASDPVAALPIGITVPWGRIAQRLGRTAGTSYASVILENWTRPGDGGSFEPERLHSHVLLTGTDEESWLYRIVAVAEQRGARALRAVGRLFRDVAGDDPHLVGAHLDELQESLRSASVVLRRLPERCGPGRTDPRVVCFLASWTGATAAPAASRGIPAVSLLQSPFLQTADAALGIGHIEGCRRIVLAERELMPPSQRRFIKGVEKSLDLRAFVRRHSGDVRLRLCYNGCVDALAGLRALQSDLASSYFSASGDPAEGPADRLGALLEWMLATTRESVL